MRKHFLLLFLTLLSATAFAVTDISSDPKVSMSTGNVTYGGSTDVAIQVLYDGYKLTAGEDKDYTWDKKYYKDEACTTEAGAINALTVGTYYVKVKGVGVYTGTRVASFQVDKKEITVKLKADLTKVYGEADPALTDDNINWDDANSQFVGKDTKSVFTGTLTYTHKGVNVGTYDLDVTGLTADNYTLKVEGGLKINAKLITAEFITAVTLSEYYKGAAYTEFAVDVKDGSTVLVPGTDFEVKVYSDKDLKTEATAKDYRATPYYLAVASKDKANYSVSKALAAGTFTIKKAGLTIRVLPQSKYYDNTNTLPSNEEGTAYQILGKFGEDKIGTVSLSGNTGVDHADYPITPKVDTENANYDYNYVPATFTIKKRPITITPVAAQKVLNQDDSKSVVYTGGKAGDNATTIGYAGVTVTVTALNGNEKKADEVWNTLKAVDWDKMKGTYDAKKADGNGTLRVVRTGKGKDEQKGTYANALSVTKEDKGTVWNNYEVTPGTADFEITGGKIYISAIDQNKVYGDDDPDWTAVLDENYIVTGLSKGESLKKAPTLKRVEGEDAKTYTINISGAEAPAGYQDIVYAFGTFTITKAPLTVTMPVKNVKAGKTAEATLADITKDGIKITGLKKDEVAIDTYTLTLNGGLKTEESKLTDQTNAQGYILTLTDAIFKNYSITGGDNEGKTIAGKLIVGKGGTVENLALTCSADATDYNAILAAAGEKKNVTITFTNRNRKVNETATEVHTWAANKWNALVLPFDITVAELSNVLGHAGDGAFNYAVVNTIKKDAPEGKFQFQLFTGTIPANTPFMVKTVGKITTLPTAEDAKTINVAVNFGEKTIVAPAAETVAAEFENGFKLVGKYANYVLDKDKPQGDKALYRFMFGDDDSDFKGIGAKSANTWTIVPFDCYVDLTGNTQAARNVTFEFEEADGTTTIIKSLSAEQNVNTEGWYTINGVKLQGVPTEKGIYINNGKKVVIK